MGNVTGVRVDEGAEPLNEAVTVLVTPAGNEIDADDWSHANNLRATGCTVKDGYPEYPGDEPRAASQEPARPAPPQRPTPTQVAPSPTSSSASA